MTPVLAPYFSLARAEWIPRVVTWDSETGFFERLDGPEGFREYRMALEASRFLGEGRGTTMNTGIVIGLILALLVFGGCASLQAQSVQQARAQAIADQRQYCYTLMADHRLDRIRNKVALTDVREQTFAMLTDDTRATAEERPAIAAWAELTAQCLSYARSRVFPYVPPQMTPVLDAAARVTEGYKADLYRGALTYGEFAKKRGENFSQMNAALTNIEIVLRVQDQNAQFQAQTLANQSLAIFQQEYQFQQQQQQQYLQMNRGVVCHTYGYTTFCH